MRPTVAGRRSWPMRTLRRTSWQALALQLDALVRPPSGAGTWPCSCCCLPHRSPATAPAASCGCDWHSPTQVGLLRLRRCSASAKDRQPTLQGRVSLIRELHVYGTAVAVHARDASKLQHQVGKPGWQGSAQSRLC